MKSFSFIVAIAAFLSSSVLGQLVKMSAFPVERSSLIEQVKALKTSDPRLSAADWAKAADAILQRDGVNASISFDAATCENIKKVRDSRKDPKTPIRLNATLKSVDAEKAALVLPEPEFAADDCGGCFIELPVLQLTATDFITRVRDRNIKFELPTNFIIDQIQLMDAKNPTSMKKIFRVPFRATPIGITYEESAVYLGFQEPELHDLALMVFDEGTFEIVTRKDAEEGGAGTILDASKGSDTKQIRFDRWRSSYLLSFKSACPR